MSVPGRGSRNRKPSSQMICPVCGVTVRSSEIESHFKAEMKKFESCGATKNRKDVVPGEPLGQYGRWICSDDFSNLSPITACDSEPSSSSGRPKSSRSPSTSTAATSDPSWTTYQQIRANRQTRLKVYNPSCTQIHSSLSTIILSRQRAGNASLSRISVPFVIDVPPRIFTFT